MTKEPDTYTHEFTIVGSSWSPQNELKLSLHRLTLPCHHEDDSAQFQDLLLSETRKELTYPAEKSKSLSSMVGFLLKDFTVVKNQMVLLFRNELEETCARAQNQSRKNWLVYIDTDSFELTKTYQLPSNDEEVEKRMRTATRVDNEVKGESREADWSNAMENYLLCARTPQKDYNSETEFNEYQQSTP